MKILWIIALSFSFLSTHTASAETKKNIVIDSAALFQRWCQTLSHRYFRQKQQQQAYNWSASTIRQVNDYQTRGQWKVNGTEKEVSARVKKPSSPN